MKKTGKTSEYWGDGDKVIGRFRVIRNTSFQELGFFHHFGT